MIVTGFPRSGTTKFCYDLANKLGYTFYDEIFDIGVASYHKTIGLHELKLDTHHPKTPAFLKSIDLNTAVVNNHEINFFSLERTDIFLSRKNIQDAVWSFVAHVHQTVGYENPNLDPTYMYIVVRQILSRYGDRLVFFNDYVIENNKTITIPDLVYSDSTAYREKYSRFTTMVNDIGDRLRLPEGLEYK